MLEIGFWEFADKHADGLGILAFVLIGAIAFYLFILVQIAEQWSLRHRGTPVNKSEDKE